jgi:hypothetical protein
MSGVMVIAGVLASRRGCEKSDLHRPPLEHDAKKWEPVFRKNRAATMNKEHDVIQSNRIML